VLTYHCWLEIEKDGPGYVFPAARFAEEGLKAFVARAGLRWQHAVRLYAVFQAIQLPAGIAHLYASLTDVHREYLTLSISILIKL